MRSVCICLTLSMEIRESYITRPTNLPAGNSALSSQWPARKGRTPFSLPKLQGKLSGHVRLTATRKQDYQT